MAKAKVIRKEQTHMGIVDVVRCNNCKKELHIFPIFANTCSCGTEYNSLGSELAPRSQWGYETGEDFNG